MTAPNPLLSLFALAAVEHVRTHSPPIASALGLREHELRAIADGVETVVHRLDPRMRDARIMVTQAPLAGAPALGMTPPPVVAQPAPEKPQKRQPRARKPKAPRAPKVPKARKPPKAKRAPIEQPPAPTARTVTPIAQGTPDSQAWRTTAARAMRRGA